MRCHGKRIKLQRPLFRVLPGPATNFGIIIPYTEAAVLFLRHNQPGKEYFTKLEPKHGKAKALTVLAHKLARTVYYMLTREQAFDLQRFVSASPLRGETEPAV